MSNVPKLRFKDFSGEWKEIPIGKVLSVGSGKDYKHLSNGDIPVYGTGGYMLSVNDYLYDGESVGIGRKGTIDKPIYLTGKFWTVDTLFYTHSFKNSIPKFIYSIFQRINWKLYNEASGVPSLSKSTIEKIKIFMPSEQEQEKIASFLNQVDTKIEQLTKKESLLQDYKKGVMQKIFNQEIRFKDDDGSEFVDWKEKKLSEIAIKRNSKNKDNSINTVLTNSAEFGIVNQQDYFDKDIANQNNLEGYYIVEKDDFIYNPRISLLAPVGPMKRNKLNQGVMSPLYTVLEIQKECRDFYEYYFETTLWHRYMNQIANFGARHDRMNITNNDFMKMPLPFPCIEEQNKIANFLSSIGTKIKDVQNQLEQSKEFKKALLQQMFM